MARNPDAERKKAIKAFKKAVYSPNVPISAIRENYDALFGHPLPPDAVDLEEAPEGEIPCDIITPEFAVADIAILYAHGGGFVSGSRQAYRSFCASLSHEAACRLILPEYRLAPEHPYPEALENLLAVFEGAAMRLARSVVLAGDGAGGNLALSLIHLLKAKYCQLPAAVVLFSPWADISGAAHRRENPDPVFTHEILDWQALQYALDISHENPLVSPIFGDFSGFPPMYIQCGSSELLAEDSMRLAEKAAASGAKVELEVFEGMWHFFQSFDSAGSDAARAVKKAGEWIRNFQKKRAER